MSNSTIVWFQKWPIDALTEVAKHFVLKIDIKTANTEKLKLMKAMGLYHDTVRNICLEYYEKLVSLKKLSII
jgi:hypothetical protein